MPDIFDTVAKQDIFDRVSFGLRVNGTPKGTGFLGILEVKGGGVATEFSIGVQFDGRETQIPTLVPTLSEEEINLMVNDIIPNRRQIPDTIVQKAIEHAKGRISQGQSPFKTDIFDRVQVLDPESTDLFEDIVPPVDIPGIADPADVTVAPVEAPPSTQQFFRQAPERTSWQQFKRFFTGDRPPLPPNAERMEKFDRVFDIAIGTPLRVFLKFSKGKTLNLPDLVWAGIKKITPDSMWTEEVKKMDLDQAMDWAAGHDPSGFEEMIGGLAEFMGRLGTAKQIGQATGILGTKATLPKQITKLIRAGEAAKLFGLAATGEQFSKLIAETIDPQTDYQYEGAMGVLKDMGIGAGLSLAVSGIAEPALAKTAQSAIGKKIIESANRAMIEFSKRFPQLADAFRKNPRQEFVKMTEDAMKARGMKPTDFTPQQKAYVRNVAREFERRYIIAFRNYKPTPDIVTRGPRRRGLQLATRTARDTQAIEFVRNALRQEKFAALDEKARAKIGQRMLAEQGVEVELEELAETPPTVGRQEPQPTLAGQKPAEAAELAKEAAGAAIAGETQLERIDRQLADVSNDVIKAAEKRQFNPHPKPWTISESEYNLRVFARSRPPSGQTSNPKHDVVIQNALNRGLEVPPIALESLTVEQIKQSESVAPWTMTKNEWELENIKRRNILSQLTEIRDELGEDAGLGKFPTAREDVGGFPAETHKTIVERAVKQDKPVPREVLEEYKSEKWAQDALAKPPATVGVQGPQPSIQPQKPSEAVEIPSEAGKAKAEVGPNLLAARQLDVNNMTDQEILDSVVGEKTNEILAELVLEQTGETKIDAIGRKILEQVGVDANVQFVKPGISKGVSKTKPLARGEVRIKVDTQGNPTGDYFVTIDESIPRPRKISTLRHELQHIIDFEKEGFKPSEAIEPPTISVVKKGETLIDALRRQNKGHFKNFDLFEFDFIVEQLRLAQPTPTPELTKQPEVAPKVTPSRTVAEIQSEIDSLLRERKSPPTELLAEFNAAVKEAKRKPKAEPITGKVITVEKTSEVKTKIPRAPKEPVTESPTIPLKGKEAQVFREEVRTQGKITEAEEGEVGIEPAGASLTDHIDTFHTYQLPSTSKIPQITKQMKRINGLRLAGKLTPQEANRKIYNLRKEVVRAAINEKIALRVSKKGKVKIALRQSGVFVPEEVATYKKYKDIEPILGGGQDIARAIQQMDGSLSIKEKLKVKGQAGPIERFVLWRTRKMSVQKLNWLKEKTIEIRGILSAKKGSIEDKEINIILEQIGKGGRDLPIKEVLNKKTYASMSKESLKAALELRQFYDDLIDEQSAARLMRGQDEILYRRNYSPHILRDTTIWAQVFMRGETAKVLEKKDLPDYVKPNKQFNPRAEARLGDMPYELRVKSARELAESYIITASKDIFNTSIIQNNKAFIDQLKGQGLEKSAEYLAEWTATSFAGIKPRLDRAIKLPKWAAGSLRYFNRLRNLAVFPLNVAWSLSTQPLSLSNTIGRYGLPNTVRGFFQWLKPSVRKQAAQDYFSFIVKTTKRGGVTKQDASNLLGENIKTQKTVGEFVENFTTILLTEMEKLLTGTSIRAAHITGLKRGLKGEALKQFASDGGGKTQSMYNDEDKPMILRSLLVKSAAPYQTYAFEVANTFREWAGRTGTPPDTKLYAIWSVTRWLAALIVLKMIANTVRGRKWSWWDLVPIPFREFWLTPIAHKLTGEFVPGSAGLPAPVETGTRVAKGINDVLEEGNWRKLRNEMLKYGPGVFGVPGGVQWARMVDAIIVYSSGGLTDRKGKVMFEMKDPEDLARAIFTGVWTTEGGQEKLEPPEKKKEPKKFKFGKR